MKQGGHVLIINTAREVIMRRRALREPDAIRSMGILEPLELSQKSDGKGIPLWNNSIVFANARALWDHWDLRLTYGVVCGKFW
jgi:hypothetical protein